MTRSYGRDTCTPSTGSAAPEPAPAGGRSRVACPYSVHALWSAAQYGVGVVAVVLANGRHAIMDELARAHGEATRDGGGPPSWPAFEEVSVQGLARALVPRRPGGDVPRAGAHTRRGTLAGRREPLVLDVRVVPERRGGSRLG